MKTTERFDKAVTKLYKAFNEGTLNAFNCKACAVGNILGHGDWYGCSVDSNDSVTLTTIERYGIEIYSGLNNSGYSELELEEVEFRFLCAFKGARQVSIDFFDSTDKERQFNGLIAVIEYLASLDEIEIPDATKTMFEEVLI